MSIFSIGLSGLNTAQVALNTTSNNITNVYTPGYNRQITILGESGVGNGVQVDDVQRQFSQFVAGQLNRSQSASSALDSYQTQISQIDSLLADSKSNLSTLMQGFFSSLTDLSSTPSDPSARQGVIGAADTMTAQFRSLDGYLNDMQQGINSQIGDQVFQLNNLSKQMASLNQQISLAKARTGEAPNSLLDQRDQVVADMSKIADVELTVQDGGSYNITVGGGQTLVSGTNSFSLQAIASPSDPTRTVVGYQDGAGNVRALDESSITGGELGGLLTFRSETLDQTQNQLGQISVALAQGFNAQHAQGYDLNGDAGGDFFTIGQPVAFSNANNTGGATLSASLSSDLSGLTANDYDVTYSGGTYTVTPSDGSASFSVTPDPSTGALSFGGMTVTVSGTPQNGDSFQLQPVRRAAGQLQNAIHDTAKIAAAQKSGATGDNSNSLALQNLQNSKLVGGIATLSQAYASLVGDVGNQANVVQANQTAQQGLTNQLSALQQSDSGVNLDEEAANLIRYQQYYQASAKIISTGVAVFDTVLNIGS
ncbi:flagellar hook-associated protein FlgK [Azotobacter bryophylli]|uniref:Flagellar hook-associated protein 1 n=1 Tax=Azotobacter bryophylli TaxID=1986537 RepID=A0ABV7ASN5_9GAMM